MLDDNPVLKERLMKFGAFAGIGIGAIAAVEVLVTGGFDIGATRAPYDRDDRVAPNAYVRVVQAAQSLSDSVRSVSWDDPLSMTADAATSETLIGSDDGAPPPAATRATSTDDLRREIEALYAQDEAYVEEPANEDAEAYDEPHYEVPTDEEEEEAAIVYENESPW